LLPLQKKHVKHLYRVSLYYHSKGTNNSEEAKQLGSNTIAELGKKHLKVLPKRKLEFQLCTKGFMG
jgi:hypothetical protein